MAVTCTFMFGSGSPRLRSDRSVHVGPGHGAGASDPASQDQLKPSAMADQEEFAGRAPKRLRDQGTWTRLPDFGEEFRFRKSLPVVCAANSSPSGKASRSCNAV